VETYNKQWLKMFQAQVQIQLEIYFVSQKLGQQIKS